MARILTVEQAAEKLQMTTKAVREYLRTGKLPGRKVGNAWRVLDSDLERWISTGQEARRKHKPIFGLLADVEGLSSDELIKSRRKEAEQEERRLSGDSGENSK